MGAVSSVVTVRLSPLADTRVHILGSMRHHFMVSTSREANDSDARKLYGICPVRCLCRRTASADGRARPAESRGSPSRGGCGGPSRHAAAPGWARVAFRPRLLRAARAILS